MKTCVKCGSEIVYGINGCMMMKECFNCHGGFPQYVPLNKVEYVGSSWDELDSLEDNCLGDDEF